MSDFTVSAGLAVRAAYAEGNALGKGPVVFHLPQQVISELRARSNAGDAPLKQLEMRMFRYVHSTCKCICVLHSMHCMSRAASVHVSAKRCARIM